MNDECIICLEELKYNKAVLKCGHTFHYDCIVSWMNNTKNYKQFCPICRNTDNEIINILNPNTNSETLTHLNSKEKKIYPISSLNNRDITQSHYHEYVNRENVLENNRDQNRTQNSYHGHRENIIENNREQNKPKCIIL